MERGSSCSKGTFSPEGGQSRNFQGQETDSRKGVEISRSRQHVQSSTILCTWHQLYLAEYKSPLRAETAWWWSKGNLWRPPGFICAGTFLWSQRSQLWVVDHCISLQAFISPSPAAEHLCQTPGTLETNTEINQPSVLQLSGVSLETQK